MPGSPEMMRYGWRPPTMVIVLGIPAKKVPFCGSSWRLPPVFDVAAPPATTRPEQKGRRKGKSATYE
jgi:hypothetical protein